MINSTKVAIFIHKTKNKRNKQYIFQKIEHFSKFIAIFVSNIKFSYPIKEEYDITYSDVANIGLPIWEGWLGF